MYGWYVCFFKRARGKHFLQKDGFLGLTPVYSKTTALSKTYLYLSSQCEKFVRKKMLAFQKQKVDRQVTMALRPFSRLNFKTSPLFFNWGIRSAGCWLSRAVGSQNAVVLMLRKLLLLEGS